MIAWPFSLTVFFLVTIGTLGVLLLLERYTHGTPQFIIRMLIHAVSVVSFIAFAVYLSTTLMRFCSPEITRTVVIAVIIFVLLAVGLFYYMSRRKI